VSDSIKAGLALAQAALANGSAKAKLQAFVAHTQQQH
jgi:anthranilate phosphoribosyltransferase